MVDFQKKGLDKKKVFVVRDEAPYFSEALGFSLPSLLVNPALPIIQHVNFQGFPEGACPQTPQVPFFVSQPAAN